VDLKKKCERRKRHYGGWSVESLTSVGYDLMFISYFKSMGVSFSSSANEEAAIHLLKMEFL